MVAHSVTNDAGWRDIPEFPRYQAHVSGAIRSSATGTWATIKPYRHPNTGYLAVTMRVSGTSITRSVHRLVAAAFLGPAEGRDVNHRNGDKTDNRLDNLEYLSRGDNHRHAYRTRIRRPVGLKIRDEDIPAIVALRGVQTQREIGKRYGVTATVISRLHQQHRAAGRPSIPHAHEN